MYRIILITFSLLLSFSTFAADYKVGVKNAPPFVFERDGKLTGYSIDYIRDVFKEITLADGTNDTLTFVNYETVNDLLTATENGDVDLSIAALSTTAEREKRIDFSHPYFTTNVAIAVPDGSNSFVASVLALGRNLVFAILGFVLLMYIVGFLMDRVDGDAEITNVHEGAWWAVVTASTVGYGDYAPKTGIGRLFAATWIVICLFLVSLFTGYVSSLMTVDRLSEAPLHLSDLNNKKVGVVHATTSETLLLKNGINYNFTDTIETGLRGLTTGEFDAIVYDNAMLQYLSKKHPIKVWPMVEQTEYYSIAFPPNSEDLKEKVNLRILSSRDSILTHTLKATYF